MPVEERMESVSLLSTENRTALGRARMPLTYAVSKDCLNGFLRTAYSLDNISPTLLVSSLPKHGVPENFPYHASK